MNERQFTEYVHDGFLKGYQKYREIFIPVEMPLDTHLFLVVGTKTWGPHNFVPGFIRRYHLRMDENGRWISEIFPCLDDERSKMRAIILSEKVQKFKNYTLEDDTVHFLNIEPGNIRINSMGGRRGYAAD